MLRLSTITLLLPWIPGYYGGRVYSPGGGSLTIPCHYEPQYVSYVKYWCQGRTKEFCTILARTDDHHLITTADQKVNIFDDPVQLVFTVTMNDMKEGESGWYMCGVEIGGIWNADDTSYTNIKVINGMSVVNSRISGEEGSSVTIECLYSERYRKSEKKWCRSGDWRSCLSTGSDGSYNDSSVAIRDDTTGAFTVTFKKLQIQDTAWYWCSTGQQKISVHLQVTPQPTTIAPFTRQSFHSLLPAKSIIWESWSSHSPMLAPVVVGSSIIVLMIVAILTIKFTKLNSMLRMPFEWTRGARQVEIAERERVPREVEGMKAKFSGYSKDAGEFQNAAVLFLNKDSQDVHIY